VPGKRPTRYTFGDSPTFTRHLDIAYGSAVETGELLRLALDAEVLAGEAGRTLRYDEREIQSGSY
jgi:hypothetical protein